MPKVLNLTGQSYNRLTCISFIETRNNHRYWLAKCTCGNTVEVSTTNIRSGAVKSCGCLQKEVATACFFKHGKSKGYLAAHPEVEWDSRYGIWQDIHKRCNNPNFKDYKYYGGKGIKVCPEWGDYLLFEKDMGPRPDKTYSIERRDGNGDYCASNCYWATPREQALNRAGHSRWKEVTIDGIKYPSYARASLATGIAVHTLQKLFKLKKETTNV